MRFNTIALIVIVIVHFPNMLCEISKVHKRNSFVSLDSLETWDCAANSEIHETLSFLPN